MNMIDFITNPWEAETLMWADPETGQIVSQCPTCGAEARHTTEQLLDFEFRHRSWCPIGLRIAPAEA